MFKEYEQKYEKVFNTEYRKKLDFNEKQFSLYGDEIVSLEQYKNLLRNEIISYQQEVYDRMIKIFWLFRKFTYYGYRRKKSIVPRGKLLDRAFGYFMSNIVGAELRAIVRSYSFIDTYLDIFYPDFENLDPFKIKLEYPYKFITLEYLSFVKSMDEKKEILDMAEDRRMEYADFMDYVLNYISCLNEEKGYEYYGFSHCAKQYRSVTKNK